MKIKYFLISFIIIINKNIFISLIVKVFQTKLNKYEILINLVYTNFIILIDYISIYICIKLKVSFNLIY